MWEHIIKVCHKEIGWDGVDWIDRVQDGNTNNCKTLIVLKYYCPVSVMAKSNESVDFDICNSELIWNIILVISWQMQAQRWCRILRFHCMNSTYAENFSA